MGGDFPGGSFPDTIENAAQGANDIPWPLEVHETFALLLSIYFLHLR